MDTGYRRQTYFNPSDDQQTLIEKLNREFQALERARALSSGSTTIVNQGGSSGSSGGSGGGSTIVIRLLDGSLVLTAINELVLDQTVGLTLAALSGSSAKIGLALTTDLVPEGLVNLYFTDARAVEAVGKVTGEATGFKHEKDDTPNSPSAISFNDANRTFTIQPTGTNFKYWINGVEHVVAAAKTKQIADTTGLHFIYFDSAGDLQETTTWDVSILVDSAYVAVVYWNSTAAKQIYMGDERHGNAMSWATHRLIHSTIGTRYLDGLALADFSVDGDGSSATHAEFSTVEGRILDEDLLHFIATKTLPAQLPIYYKFGATAEWRIKTADNYPVIFTGTVGADYAGTRLPYNQLTGGAWQLTEVGNQNFVLVHYFATNDPARGIIGIQGQATYGTLTAARAGANEEINAIITTGLPFEEYHPIATVLFQTSTSPAYTNAPKARIRLIAVGENYVDWREGNLSPAVGATVPAHNNLSGLQGGTGGQYYHLILTDYTKVTTETFVNMNLSGYLHLASMTAPATPAASNMLMYMRTIAGTPNEVRWVTLDPNGQESILHSYTV